MSVITHVASGMILPMMLVTASASMPQAIAGRYLPRYGMSPNRFFAEEPCSCAGDFFAAGALFPVLLPLLIANWIARCSGLETRSGSFHKNGRATGNAW